jgi:hypothetical protein
MYFMLRWCVGILCLLLHQWHHYETLTLLRSSLLSFVTHTGQDEFLKKSEKIMIFFEKRKLLSDACMKGCSILRKKDFHTEL